MNRIWFSSDYHLDHSNVIRYCDRPFDNVEEMNAEIVKRHNEVVDKDDIVFMVGDIAFNDKILYELVPKMNGYRILVSGNHDQTFQRRSKAAKFVHKYVEDGIFMHVTNGLSWKLFNGTTVLIDHFPYYGDHENREERYPELRPRDEGGWLLHGHVHELWKQKDRMINVGVDQWDFYPVSEDTIIGMIDEHERLASSMD